MKYLIWVSVLSGIFLYFTSCDNRSSYRQVVNKELKSGQTIDSIFMGYQFGMTRKDFYAHSWQLNRKKLVTNGGANLTIKREIEYLDHSATMLFFPAFEDDKIHKMLVRYRYDGWAPWNKELGAEYLKKDIIEYYNKHFGTNFRVLKDAHNQEYLLSINGNREIEITTEHDNSVVVIFRDLRIESNIKRIEQQAINL